jgi:hypothetical protein
LYLKHEEPLSAYPPDFVLFALVPDNGHGPRAIQSAASGFEYWLALKSIAGFDTQCGRRAGLPD